MRRHLAALLVAVLALPGCALHTGPRHTATVSIVSAHAVLTTIDDAEMKLVCGRAGAPQAPYCIPVSKHQQISAMLKQAYDLEISIAGVIRAIPDGSPLPADVMAMTVQVGALINQIMLMLPEGKPKEALVQRIGPGLGR